MWREEKKKDGVPSGSGRRRLFVLLACCLMFFPLFSEELLGRVVRVADGDTMTVLAAGNIQEKIRLHGIDAPEKDQAFGQKSKQRLSGYAIYLSLQVSCANA